MKVLFRIAAAFGLLLGTFVYGAASSDENSEVVIVPYDSKKPIDEQKPDQFYLPYERFLQLWEAAKQHRAGPALEPAKFPFALTAARYDGVQSERSVAFTGKLDITTTNDAWVKVPLPFSGVKIGGLKIDGAAAVFDGSSIVIEKPGRHVLEITFEIPLAAGENQFGWGIPRTSATLVSLTLLDERTHAVITPGSGVVERVENGKNLVVAALGSTQTVQVKLQSRSAAARVTEPAVTSVETKLAVHAGTEDADTNFKFSFPGARLDHFKVYLENGLTLFGLAAVNLKSWKLSPEGGQQALEITLNEAVAETFGFSIQTQRALAPPLDGRVAPVFSAAAKRVEYAGTAIFADKRLDISVKPTGNLRQISWKGTPVLDASLVAAYAGGGKLAYSVKVAEPAREARVDYVFQVNRRKIELMASFQLFPKGDDLSTVTLALPAQFEVQAVESGQLQDWWRDGNTLHLRFRGAPAEKVPLVVYLKRQYAAAPTELDVRPLALEGFKRVSGEAVIAAHKGVEVSMKLVDGVEMAPEKAATDFQILPPLERKRGFAFKAQNFSAQITLTALPAKYNALWVMHARAHEGWLALSAHAQMTVRQGSVDRASFTLPKTAPEARVSGSEVRETRSHVEGDQRIYDVQFQNDVFETVEFTLDFELPDTEEATLPAITFPGAQMTNGYVLTENLSEYEMRLKTSNVDPAPTSEIPFLPELSKGAGVFRTQPNWSVSIALDRLEKAEARAAFVAWAEMTSALRADGTEWHRASYRLQNRSLQFLPVRLPDGAELMSARVAGQSVRADSGRVDGKIALLVPLIKTKPGDLSYNVELVYRISGPLPGWRAKRGFQEPELPGITVERTLWNVWLPDDRKLDASGGNMNAVLGDLNKTEKLEGKLQELKQLVTIAGSSRVSEESRENARRNLEVLKKELEVDNRDDQFSETNANNSLGLVPKPTPGDEVVAKKAQVSQGSYVASKRKALNVELGREMQKLSESKPSAPAQPASTLQGAAVPANGQWAFNNAFAGNRAAATPNPSNLNANGNLFLNDNIVLQNSEAVTKQSPVNPGPNTTKGSMSITAPGGENLVLQTARGNNLRQIQGQDATQAQASTPEPAAPAAAAGPVNPLDLGPTRAGRAYAPPVAPLPPPEAPAAPAMPVPSAPAAVPVAPPPMPEAKTANPSTKSEAERLQPTGRISLDVHFPTEGQVYHFEKLKADARLELTVTDPSAFGRWQNFAIFLLLAGALYGAGRFFEKRWKARTQRAAAVQ